jgi:hypothetical protein
MAQQAKQAAQKLGGMFPQGSGKGIGGAVGAIAVLGALGYGVNAALFNGNLNLHMSGVDCMNLTFSFLQLMVVTELLNILVFLVFKTLSITKVLIS